MRYPVDLLENFVGCMADLMLLSMGDAWRPCPRQGHSLREAVRAPLLRADSIVDEEQPVRVVFSFDFSQARVISSPVRLLPSLLEVVALAHIRSCVPRDGSKLIHTSIDALRSFSAF